MSLKKEMLRTTRQAQVHLQMALGASSPLAEIVRSLPVASWNEAQRTSLMAELIELGGQIEACGRRVAAVIGELESLQVERRMVRL